MDPGTPFSGWRKKKWIVWMVPAAVMVPAAAATAGNG